MNLKRVILKHFTCQHTIPNIMDDMFLYLRETDSLGTLHKVSVPEGQYSAVDFISQFPSTFSTTAGTTLVSATLDTSGFVQLVFSSPVYILSIDEIYKFDGSRRSLNKVLGGRHTNPLVVPPVATSWNLPSIREFCWAQCFTRSFLSTGRDMVILLKA
jgi:hypothetical protein